MFSNFIIVIIGDFNINLSTKIVESSALHKFMNKYKFKVTFLKNITINDPQIDHI